MIKNKNNILLIGGLLTAILALSGCSDVKQELGVGRNSPDEFMVVKRAPLTLPPDYTLRPPSDPSEAQPRALSSKSPSLTNRKNLTSHPCLMLCPQASLSSTRDLTR